MTTVTHRGISQSIGGAGPMARRLAGPGLLGGLLGGLAMIVVMILVMGAAGMGYATPLNLGMAAFVFTITPPLSMLPALMPLMGISLPASVMAQLSAAISSGHVSPAMMMGVPLMRTAGGVIAAGVAGGAVVYVITRWALGDVGRRAGGRPSERMP